MFTIGNTPTYPKLRTKNGWFDMRDLIDVDKKDIRPHDCRYLTPEEIKELETKYGINLEEWKQSILS